MARRGQRFQMIVWLASYPRSGADLLADVIKQALRLRVYNIDSWPEPCPGGDVNRRSRDRTVIAGAARERFLASAGRRRRYTLVRTHGLPSDNSRAIYVVRDGRAVVGDYHRQLLRQPSLNPPELLDVLLGAVPFGGWSAHVQAWDPRRRPETLLLRYEDLLADSTRAVAAVARFLGRDEPAAGNAERRDGDTGPADSAGCATGLSAGQEALFDLIHGPTQRKLGYASAPIAPGPAEAAESLRAVQHRLGTLHEAWYQSAQGWREYALQLRDLVETPSTESADATNAAAPSTAGRHSIAGAVRAVRRRLSRAELLAGEARRRMLAYWPRRNWGNGLVPAQYRFIPPQEQAIDDGLGIAVFAFTRGHLAESILTSLGHQGVLPHVHVFMDGDQGKPALRHKLDAVEASLCRFPVARIHRNRGNQGFRKLILHAMAFMQERYDRLVFLEDDCFPTRRCIQVFLAELQAVEQDSEVFSVYGHPFGVPGEGRFARFQGWGWATHASKLKPIREELARLYQLPEEEYLAYVREVLTPEIEQRIDLTPGRQPTATLRHFFAWDETLCLITALRGMVHQCAAERIIYNCGASNDSTHFQNIDHFRRPPFNMIDPTEAWGYF